MRLKVTSVAAMSAAALVLAIVGPLPAQASDADGASEPAPTPTATVAEQDDAPEDETTSPTEPGGSDLIEVTGDTTAPIPLPIERVDLPLINAPLFNLTQPSPPAATPEPRFGGGATGAFVEATVGDAKVKIGKVGGVNMPSKTGYEYTEVSRIEQPIWPLAGLVFTRGIESKATALENPVSAESVTKIARVELRPTLDLWFLNLPYTQVPILVDAIESSAVVSRGADGEYVTTAESKLGKLTINGKTSPLKDFAPNTTIDVVGLGKIVINEQKFTRSPGEKYAAKVHALHITLSTAKFGLPAGADIYVGSAEAVLYE